MADKEEGFGSAFWKGAAGTVGAGIALWLIGWLKPLWSFTQDAFRSLFTHLAAQSQWPNWSAYLVSSLAAMAFFSWALRYWRNRKDNHNRFNQFSFLGSVWRWNGISSLPYGLRPYCPMCDTMLVYENTGGYYSGEDKRVTLHCERCRTSPVVEPGDMNYLRERVTREIDRLLRTGEWRGHVPESTK